MSERKNWTREELIVAFNLYCKIPVTKVNAKHKAVISLANAIGRTPSAVSWKLVNFASLDPSLKGTNMNGASNTGKLDKVIFEEFCNNWEELAYESELLISQFLGKNIEETSEKEDLDIVFDIKEGKTKERLIKTRVNQSFFRNVVLSSYDNKCCITGISIPELLVASHIIPWSRDEKNRLNPQNGICLNSIHDKAFDKGYITIDLDYKIKVSKAISNYKNEINIQKFFYDFDNKEIILPKRFSPKQDFLIYHNQNIFKK